MTWLLSYPEYPTQCDLSTTRASLASVLHPSQVVWQGLLKHGTTWPRPCTCRTVAELWQLVFRSHLVINLFLIASCTSGLVHCLSYIEFSIPFRADLQGCDLVSIVWFLSLIVCLMVQSNVKNFVLNDQAMEVGDLWLDFESCWLHRQHLVGSPVLLLLLRHLHLDQLLHLLHHLLDFILY